MIRFQTAPAESGRGTPKVWGLGSVYPAKYLPSRKGMDFRLTPLISHHVGFQKQPPSPVPLVASHITHSEVWVSDLEVLLTTP